MTSHHNLVNKPLHYTYCPIPHNIVIRNKSLEIWAVKLRILQIYENILKVIATARSESTAKQGNKASYNTYYKLSLI